jgi:hypothetical protein
MTAKEFLKRPMEIEKQIDLILDKIQLSRERAYIKGISYESVKGQNQDGDKKIVRVTADIVASEEQLKQATKEKEKVIREVESVIKKVKSADYREFLRRKYLMFQPVEGYYNKLSGEYIRGIPDSMEMSARQIYRIQSEAINAVDEVIGKTPKKYLTKE